MPMSIPRRYLECPECVIKTLGLTKKEIESGKGDVFCYTQHFSLSEEERSLKGKTLHCPHFPAPEGAERKNG